MIFIKRTAPFLLSCLSDNLAMETAAPNQISPFSKTEVRLSFNLLYLPCILTL